MATIAHSTSDPAHPSNPNNDHTKTDGTKPQTAIDVIVDPDFLPTLEKAPIQQHLKSNLLLLSLITSGVFGSWLLGLDMFQVSEGQSWGMLASGLMGVVGVIGLGVWFTGALWIDWWELVLGYWWLSMPVAAGAGLLFVMAQEKSKGLKELS